MITNEEKIRSNESYTKKDFIQIYKEMIDIAGKISERIDLTATNESDPMIVLMKLLAFIGDKNNYYIDKRILENFMPSATQVDSMRKLCDLFGYNAKYIQSGETILSMTYTGEELLPLSEMNGDEVVIDKYTQVTNEDGDIIYTTLEPTTFSYRNQLRTVKCIQGVKQSITIDNSNVIKTNNLDDNLRFYLPENRIAENGIFVRFASTDIEGEEWTKVENLNEYPYESYIWKFGYDSNKRCPYIQFPKDIASIIGGGLEIDYITSNGVEGNISARSLNKLVGNSIIVKSVINGTTEAKPQQDENGNERIRVYNAYAVTNAAEEESIDAMYNNYKKTIGTFNTLTTCRDYMNKIYQLVDENGKYLVGNVDVGDKRTDVNKSLSILTFDSFGIHYNTKSTKTDDVDDISCFDLYFYPLNNIGDSTTVKTYNNSFKPSTIDRYKINRELEANKTLCHNIKYVNDSEIYMYKDLYKLNAKVVTMYKVNAEEQQSILNNIYTALMKEFNSRKVDLGIEIPYDSILSVIEKSDERIKFVSLDEPEHNIVVMNGAGVESDFNPTSGTRQDYINSVAKNVLAGRIDLFNYEDSVAVKYGQHDATKVGGGSTDSTKVISVQPKLTISNLPNTRTSSTGATLNYTLRENELVQAISPKLVGDVDAVDGSSSTYVYTVGYYWKRLDEDEIITSDIIPANTSYRLGDGDELYIDYTNSSNNQISIKYYKDGSEYKFDKYINKVLSSTKTWEGYICPNFDLKSSYYTINIPTKKCDTESEVIGELPNAWVDCMPNGGSRGIQGLGSFGYSDELQIQKKSNTTFTDNRNIYWITNDKDNKINWEVTTLASTEKQGTYILEDGEYLMMTDEGKNDLIIFSAGTKLTTKYYPDDSSLWTLNMTNENTVSTEDIMNYGLGAFSDANWKYLKFNSSKFFNVSEMNILNLVEGNTIKAVKLTSSSIANTFNSLDMMSYVIDGSPKSIESTNGIEWNIRTRLLLNVSPSNSQHLLSDYTITGTTKSEQRLGYTLKNSTTSTLSNCYINFNYPIYSVLDNISVKTTNIYGENDNKDDFTIYSYSFTEPTYYVSAGTSTNESCLSSVFDNHRYSLSFSDGGRKTARFKLAKVDENDTAILMVYYHKSQNTITTQPTVSGTSTQSQTYTLKKFNDSTVTSGSSITLTEGMNIILINLYTCNELIINCGDDSDGTYLLSEYRILKTTSKLNSTTPNNEVTAYNSVLGLTSSEQTSLRSKLQEYDSDNEFYYGTFLDKELEINIDKQAGELLSDSKFVYDNNNVINKHIIPQIDANSFKYITISKSSQF